MSKRVVVKCDWCGSDLQRYLSQVKERNFCDRECLKKHRSKKHNPNGYQRNLNAGFLSELNRKLNPSRMTPEIRAELRAARLGKGKGKTYTKTYGRHTHRIEAEKKIGRELLPGEVVHHIDGNRRNNSPDNLEVLPSQKEHAKRHQSMRDHDVV